MIAASEEKAVSAQTGTSSPFADLHIVQQTVATLWFPEGTTQEERNGRIASALSLLEGIRPADEIEGMLAAQMVATHSAAMECLRRAMAPQQTLPGRDLNLKHASKLLQVYAKQMDALNRHRGKGQQKVTVEHVHVEAGGQAVVGNIQTSPVRRSSPHRSKAPKELTFAPPEMLETGTQPKSAARPRNR